jgi:membrane-associated phospholipid phosphatase
MSFGELNASAAITDFADGAVVLPLAGAALLIFVSLRWWRGALAWIAAVGSTLALILLLKLRFFACDQVVPGELVRNPSGHTAAAAVVYGGLATMVVRSIWDMRRGLAPLAVAISTPIAVVIGVSRLQLDKHSMLEVLVGSGIGIAGAASFALLAGSPKRDLRFGRLLLLSLLVIALFYGARMPVEAHLEIIGKDIRLLLTAVDVGIC